MTVLGSIPSPARNGFHLGPLFVHAYGLAYVVGVIAAVAITTRRWERQGGSPGLVHEVALWGFPAGLIGGRLYFLATSWNEVPHHWWGPLAIWNGGLGIWGGIALGTLGGLLVLRRRGADIPRFMDVAAPGVLVAQAIGRIGNYFNQELFGGPTSLPWGLRIDPSHRPAAYEHFATFHPTFLYELIWNLALAGALVWLRRHRRIRAPGLFALYVVGYSGFRIFEELLRVDPASHILGLRLNFFVATTLCVAGLVWFLRIQHRGRAARYRTARGGGAALGIAWLACVLAGCGQDRRLHSSLPTPHQTRISESVNEASASTFVPHTGAAKRAVRALARQGQWRPPPQRGAATGDGHTAYEGRFEGRLLHPGEFVMCADEKPSIQARARTHPSLAPSPGHSQRVEHTYKRRGALAYLGAWDVKRAELFGRSERRGGIGPSIVSRAAGRTCA